MSATWVPFINQTPYWLVLASCHRISDLPSPLKSPVLIITQDRAGEPRETAAVAVEPFISQTPTWPVAVFRHKKSCLPSPLKSGGFGMVTILKAGVPAPTARMMLAILGAPSPVHKL